MKHESVLLNECIENLNIKPNGIYVDATLGGAGHSLEIVKRLSSGLLVGFDQDEFAIQYATNRLKDYNNFKIVKSNFRNLTEELSKLGINKIDGILFDLGLSSFQIDDRKRGFSYLNNYELDMRMDQDLEVSAKDILNNYSLEDLTRIFRDYGEEKNAYQIARKIVDRRPITMTSELVKITDEVNYKVKGHSAKRVFQALRIEVNEELDVLHEALAQLNDLLNPGGRIVIITFHSLEDRIVKHYFKENSEVEIIKGMPIAIEPKPNYKVITKKPILPTDEEMKHNSRSRSAKLRVAEKI
ncbi:MAG TPA: 16S rRNA (cytosine(1402)-N(4))-methyltransferase RsmH [Acholeplasmataceae bacterium]|jgi:16S rRNA (cytosine1402-N4)-methyltransferase|nr:16S rRNA (cytosine(1402)-N(4))-methyltransferase RsmH [Acholeplasmataceae bacterium]